MNKYVRKLFSVVFQSQPTSQIVRSQPQQFPASPKEWRQYWQLQGQPWRTEPEIDAKRRAKLARRRAIVPDVEKGVYPFKGMKLSRADVEWLLATHENGQKLADWGDWRHPSSEGLDLRGADLRRVDLSLMPLTRLRAGLTYEEWTNADTEQRSWAVVLMEGSSLRWARLEGAHFYEAHLERADLREAHLEGAHFRGVHLEGANLRGAYLDGASLRNARLEGSDLRGAFFTSATNLAGIFLDNEKLGPAFLGGIRWGDAELSVVDWTQVRILGDELQARQRVLANGMMKTASVRLEEYLAVVRANRKLAVALQEQGLSEEAARFAYRAQIFQRKVFWMQRAFGKWVFSLLLALLAGYGYRMGRILVAYLSVVLFCTGAYFVLGMYYEPHLTLLEAVLTSITAFHGRVFSEPFLQPGDPQLWVTAFEAVAGLVIEGVFIAMLTQKFFGK
jgi:uncharacterized protein YjbI with pentapeptide repeats